MSRVTKPQRRNPGIFWSPQPTILNLAFCRRGLRRFTRGNGPSYVEVPRVEKRLADLVAGKVTNRA